MAVAQAQHLVKKLADLCVMCYHQYAIHPVAGRIGHMNVFL